MIKGNKTRVRVVGEFLQAIQSLELDGMKRVLQ